MTRLTSCFEIVLCLPCGARTPELTIFRHADLESAPLSAAAEQKAADTTPESSVQKTWSASLLSPFPRWFHRTQGRSRSTDDLELADVEMSTHDCTSTRTSLASLNHETIRSAQPPRDVTNSDSTRSHRVEHLPTGGRIDYFETSHSILSYPTGVPTRVITLPPGTYL